MSNSLKMTIDRKDITAALVAEFGHGEVGNGILFHEIEDVVHDVLEAANPREDWDDVRDVAADVAAWFDGRTI